MKAIAYFANGIGNLIMMMPALQAIASLTETGKIDVCLGDWQDSRKPAIMEILKAWDVVDRIIEWPRDGVDPRIYQLWFYSPHGAGCDVVNLFRSRMNYRPVPRPAWKESLIHEVDHYMEIAYSMGYMGPMPEVRFPLPEGGPSLGNLPRPRIVLCNGYFRVATGYWDKKGWPHFRAYIRAARGFFRGSMVGIGAEGEWAENEALDANFAGKLSILETAKVISQADLVVSTDTGNMHIADILGVPLIALFGPTLVSKNGPRNRRAVVLASGAECAPCQDTARFMGCRDYVCMRSITVGDVMAVTRGLLNSSNYKYGDIRRKENGTDGWSEKLHAGAVRNEQSPVSLPAH